MWLWLHVARLERPVFVWQLAIASHCFSEENFAVVTPPLCLASIARNPRMVPGGLGTPVGFGLYLPLKLNLRVNQMRLEAFWIQPHGAHAVFRRSRRHSLPVSLYIIRYNDFPDLQEPGR